MGREETRKPTAILFPGLRWKLAANALRNLFNPKAVLAASPLVLMKDKKLSEACGL